MKIITTCVKLIFAVLVFFPNILNAQKLPDKQKKSLYAPPSIKIDGIAAEWENQFQAYNKAVDLFYTLSNDDKNIYLIVQAKYQDVISKILRGGITFTINATSNEKDKNSISITYPVLEGQDMWVVVNKFFGKANEFEKVKGEAIKVDDLNELFGAKEKTITVKGVETIPDQSISIYNNDGIKSASLFDDKMDFTYELAIPIAYLKLPNNGGNSFKYNIKINAPPPLQRPQVITSSTPPPPPPPVAIGTLAATDFWGDYILEKNN